MATKSESFDAVLRHVAREHGFRPQTLLSKRRERLIILARREAFRALRADGWPINAIAIRFRCGASTVRHHIEADDNTLRSCSHCGKGYDNKSVWARGMYCGSKCKRDAKQTRGRCVARRQDNTDCKWYDQHDYRGRPPCLDRAAAVDADSVCLRDCRRYEARPELKAKGVLKSSAGLWSEMDGAYVDV
jgi:hypothetical protein